jgi:hypothetical protein
MSDLATSLDAALAELAVDPIGVLKASGVRGKLGDPCGCPVAKFIRKRIGTKVTVMVFAWTNGGRLHRMPERLRQAIRAIDNGEHPELCV